MSRNRSSVLTVLAAVSLATLAVAAARGGSAQTAEQLGVEIRTNSGAEAIYLPVAAPGQKNRLYAFVPVEGGGEVSAVRVVPVMRGNHVKFDVYAVSGDLSKMQNCADRLLMPSRLVATHTAEKHQTVTVHGEGWSASVRIVERRPEPAASKKTGGGQPSFVKASAAQEPIQEPGGCGCAACTGGIRCCPNKGDCMQCPCGTVCCTGE